MEKQRGYGRGRWPRGQLFAIVATYRSQGRSVPWIARRLGIGEGICKQAFDYFECAEIEARQRSESLLGEE